MENGNVYGNKQADRSALKILSSVNAGLYGTMRAQFRVPRLIGDDNKSIDGSGFMLHSDNAAQSYLMLNVYANADGNLIARVCVLVHLVKKVRWRKMAVCIAQI